MQCHIYLPVSSIKSQGAQLLATYWTSNNCNCWCTFVRYLLSLPQHWNMQFQNISALHSLLLNACIYFLCTEHGDVSYVSMRSKLCSIYWTYSSHRMSERSLCYGNFILANYLILDSWNTVVVNCLQFARIKLPLKWERSLILRLEYVQLIE